MIIPIIDQDLAVIKAVDTQHRNGYHISEHDYIHLKEAVLYVNKLLKEVEKIRSK